MAAPKKRSRARGTTAPFLGYEQKKEMLGFMVMLVSATLLLSLFSYNAADNQTVSALAFGDFFDTSLPPVNNALGLLGAWLSQRLIPWFLGYWIIIWFVVLLSWGYLLFRDRRPVDMPLYTMLGLIFPFQLSAFIGWFSPYRNGDLNPWIGTTGDALAQWMIRVFGMPGSFFMLLISIVVTLMLAIDRDLQKSMDRIEDGVAFIWKLLMEGVAIIRREVFGQFRLPQKKDKAIATPQASMDDPFLDSNFVVAPPQQAKKKSKKKADDLSNVAAVHPVTPDAASPAPPPAHPAPQNPFQADIKPGMTYNDLIREQMTQDQPPAPATPAQADPFAAAPPDQPPKPADDEKKDVEMKVQGQVTEEKAKKIAPAAPPKPKVRFRYPSVDLLDKSDGTVAIDYAELEENKALLLETLATHNIEIVDINAIVGPTITMYELTPAPGVKISRIKALEDDLAMALAARGIRMIAPIPGKSAIGVEIPNRQRELVRLRDLLATKRFRDAKMRLPFPIGKTIEGQVFIQDIASMPHLLIAGATGSGKSVALNALITGLLYAGHPDTLRFVMIDPKKIELQQYGRLVEHFIAMPDGATMPIITDVAQALGVLKSCEKEMEHRYSLLQKAMVRGLHEYNAKFKRGELLPEHGHGTLPYIVVVVDELADLMLTAGKEIEGPIARLAQMARAVGIHLVLATQRPSVDVITGLIKANFPSRIAFQVASKIDSRTILDQNGAEGLVGNGDMLYMKGSQVIRLQGPFVSVEEVDYVTEFIGAQPGSGPYLLPPIDDEVMMTVTSGSDKSGEERDALFTDAARIIVRTQQGSVSLLQRKLSIGYTRSARIVDQLERAGIVGPFEGSKARQVLVADEMQLDELLGIPSSTPGL